MNIINFPSAWFTNDLDEIIFESRNKSYGAYELRKHYPQRLQKAFGITILFCLVLLLWLRVSMPDERIIDKIWTPGPVTTLDQQKWIEPLGRKPDEPKPTKKDIVSLPTKVVTDSTISNQKVDSTISDFTTKGGDQNAGDSGSVTIPTSTGTYGSNFIDSSDIIIDRNKVIMNPSVMPSFPGGQKALARYLQNHLACSQFRQSNGKSGKIHLSLIVSMDGVVSNVEILRDGVGFGCGEEAVRVLQNMPRWIPGMNNDRPVNTKIIMPISMETIEE